MSPNLFESFHEETSESPKKLGTRARVAIMLSALVLAGGFAERVAEQTIDANGCTVKPGRLPTDPGTAAIANAIDMVIEGAHANPGCN